MKRYILALLAVTSFMSNTDARVSLLKYYNYQNDAATQSSFDAGFDRSTDLIRGYVLKLYGTTQIQRFYGNIEYVRGEGEKACSYRDVGNDAVASLLVALYPSAGPDFNSGGTGSLENFFTNPKDLVQVVADMLYFANRARGLFLKNSDDISAQVESIKKLSCIINDLEKVDRWDPDYDGITETLSCLLEVGSKHTGLISAQVVEEEKNIIKKQKAGEEGLLADCLARPLAIAKRAKSKIEQDLFNQVFRGDEVFKFWNGAEAKTRTKLERIAKTIVGSVMLERLNEKDQENSLKDLEACENDLNTLRKDIDNYQKDQKKSGRLDEYRRGLSTYKCELNRYKEYLSTDDNFVTRKEKLDELRDNLSDDEKKLEIYKKLDTYRNNLDTFKDKLDAYTKAYSRNVEIHPYTLGYTNDVICMYAWDVLNSEEIGLLAERLGEHKKALQKDFTVEPCDKSLTKELADNYEAGIFPFAWGTIFNGTAHYTTPKGITRDFADCAETAMRLFFAALFAKAENGEIKLDESRIPEGNLKNFFKGKDLQELSVDGHSEIRDEWVKIISGEEAYKAGVLFVCPYGELRDGAYELRGTVGNFIWTFCWLMRGYPRLIEKELNISDISNYEAPGSTSEKDLRKIKAAKRIDSIVKAVEEGKSVKKKRKIIDELAKTVDEAIEIYNDLLGIRDDVTLEAVKEKIMSYTSAKRAKVDGIVIRNMNNHREYFNLITNNHAEITGPKIFDDMEKNNMDIVEDANSGFHNTLKLYNDEENTYERSYPSLNYYMHIMGSRYNPSQDDYEIPSEIIDAPLFERQASGVCKLLLTRNFSVSSNYSSKSDKKRVRKNCSLLISKLINGADASNLSERLKRLVEGSYMPLDSSVLPLNLNVLRNSLSRINAILTEENDATVEEDASVSKDTIASESSVEEADESRARSNKEKANKRYIKMVKNVIEFIDLFEFTDGDANVVDKVKETVAIIKEEIEKRGLSENFPLDMNRTTKELSEKVSILSGVCKFKIEEE